MSDGRKRIPSSFIKIKKRIAWNKIVEKYMPEERKQNLAEIDRGSCYNKEEWLRRILRR